MAVPDPGLGDPAVQLTSSSHDPREVAEWWARWDKLSRVVRDRAVSDVLAEERASD